MSSAKEVVAGLVDFTRKRTPAIQPEDQTSACIIRRLILPDQTLSPNHPAWRAVDTIRSGQHLFF